MCNFAARIVVVVVVKYLPISSGMNGGPHNVITRTTGSFSLPVYHHCFPVVVVVAAPVIVVVFFVLLSNLYHLGHPPRVVFVIIIICCCLHQLLLRYRHVVVAL